MTISFAPDGGKIGSQMCQNKSLYLLDAKSRGKPGQ